MKIKRLIGINGGTFDPIHFGHLRPALEVLYALKLDEMRFMPAGIPVHRPQPLATIEQRCDMIELAIEDQPNFVLERLEMAIGGPSYTAQSLVHLKQAEPETGLVLMMGTDAFAKFDTWKDWQTILTLANIVVTHRPGEPLPRQGAVGYIFLNHWVPHLTQASGQIVDLPVTQLDLSATTLRAYLQHGDPVDYLMPAKVAAYIKKNHLYQP
ncbi:MAG: nicotinate-nicotinamide nucleotide adenylyltransferase [Piscirickettsiaceae bacterium CG_4_9_14_3_um_filter_43_564]|nr:nicotinate-nucleotide adenylyltransferase [Thiomicrospira sp.]OIP95075.1 MAG: nicotinate (nicotinamide) nucleotide adenylyltransferase [Thiomicrospira sp. CG2_30_44_34]PIQ05304.1 MAG: nicotinate-nicotinamide nucleotide adenylyltransferase [Piscirickettsiaceae bacterium CG18_big_fil_WC_8_21_14_2_50_44_103]PIU38397.1 MAG: nicotinate-nicotinamide nucleotide adenylyltransferase [Piscirickettsiaceae bacterium CG07_land_8_20_14_0_80_44_28]PIW58819.1 MAG: nicotinate-nicotinamide nucleotide adenylyl